MRSRRVRAAVAAMVVGSVLPVSVGGQVAAAADAPVVSLGDASGLERDAVTGSVFVPVYLSEPAIEPVVVSYFTEDDTAVFLPPEDRVFPEQFGDYQRRGTPASPRTMTIPAGAVQSSINVPLGVDDETETDETFSVGIASVSGGGSVIGDDTGVATIVDADAVSGANPAITVSSTTVHEGDSGTRRAQFQVHLSRAPSTNVTISYTTADGTATAGSDYTAKLPGTVVFAPGQISKSIDVAIAPNTTVGNLRDLRLDVAVAGGSPVEELAMSGSAQIVDDEVPVLDTTAPAMTLPSDMTTPATAPNGAVATWSATATDDVDGTVPVECTPAAGSRFAVGLTTVGCTAADTAGNTSTGSFTVTVTPFTPPEQTVATGRRHTCVLVELGAVECWGDNSEGQLGNGTLTASPTPVAVSGLSGAVAISAGSDHTCVVLADHTPRCWGDNTLGKLGAGLGGADNSTVPVTPTGLTGLEVVDIEAGGAFTCALIADGTVRCWGDNGYYQLGLTAPSSPSAKDPVTGITDAVALSSGSAHSCAVLASGRAMCWGRNENGQLGRGTISFRSSVATDVTGITNAVGVTAGDDDHSCVLLVDATAQCWGLNSDGRLGAGPAAASQVTVPVPVLGATNLTQLTAGTVSTCARDEQGAAWCWGGNSKGALGTGTAADSNVPVQVSALGTAVQTIGAGSQVCAQLVGGATRCWGDNSHGQLGNGGPGNPAPLPLAVQAVPAGTASLAAGGRHTCVLAAGGIPWCWGDNTYGQLGDGTTETRSGPVAVVGVNGAVRVAVGVSHTCAVLAAGTVRCWGRNLDGVLGDGTTTNSSTPVSVLGLTDATRVSVYGSHSCALSADGTVRCWGRNTYGQLGDGTTTSSTTPVLATDVSGAVDVAVGHESVTSVFPVSTTEYSHSCALLSSGGVRCWGRNNAGQLGGTGGGAVKVDVTGITTATAIAAGARSTCAALADGTAQCWGNNADGQLGRGTVGGFSSTPAAVTGLSGAVGVAVSGQHACAVLADGTVRCWGFNTVGQLGDGNFSLDNNPTRSSVPVATTDLIGVAAVAAANGHSCALLGDGALRCWGDNTLGRLGVGLPFARVPSSVTGLP